MMKVGKIKKDL
jgi:hypothetical protein